MTIENEITPIKFIRNLKGWNQKTMADFLGITGASYSLMDRGATKVKDEYRIKLCKEFSVDIEIFTTQIPNSEWFRFVNNNNSKDISLLVTKYQFEATQKDNKQEEDMNKRNNAQEILLRIENEQLLEENKSKQKTIDKLKKELLEMAENAQILREELKKCLNPVKAMSN
jgi:transcriptional regulator with XRE-family HTH domain